MRIGRYEIIRTLSEGGMGEVLLARDPGRAAAGGLVVIKRIRSVWRDDSQFVAMFRNEIRISALLDSPNVPRFLGAGEHEGAPFLALEYIHGADLQQVLDASRERPSLRLDPELVTYIAAGVAAALDHAHRLCDHDLTPLSVVHRDITPHNVRLGHDGAVKVIDFGVAKAANQSVITAAGVIKGKFAYMSPEQVAGGVVDDQTDIFALGIVMHEMLTCRSLFAHDDAAITISAIQSARIPRPSELTGAAIPAGLELVVMRALERDRSRRYQSADQLLEDLEELLQQPHVAGEPPPARRLGALLVDLFGDRAVQLAAVCEPDSEPGRSEVIALGALAAASDAGERDDDGDAYDADASTVKGRPTLPLDQLPARSDHED